MKKPKPQVLRFSSVSSSPFIWPGMVLPVEDRDDISKVQAAKQLTLPEIAQAYTLVRRSSFKAKKYMAIRDETYRENPQFWDSFAKEFTKVGGLVVWQKVDNPYYLTSYSAAFSRPIDDDGTMTVYPFLDDLVPDEHLQAIADALEGHPLIEVDNPFQRKP